LEFAKKDGIETFLKVLAVSASDPHINWGWSLIGAKNFRRKDPSDAEELEFMENLFDALCSALAERPVKELFLKAEGPDLMVLMMK
jgi:beta-catenin-like protein 1